MPLTPRAPAMSELSLQPELAQISALPEVRAMYAWFLTEEPKFADWQQQIARIPAPPFGEQLRTEWMLERFLELGLQQVHSDEAGNVFGVREGSSDRFVALSAHIDTVFPAGTPLSIRQQGSRLYGPGVSDNGAGLAALLATAAGLSK